MAATVTLRVRGGIVMVLLLVSSVIALAVVLDRAGFWWRHRPGREAEHVLEGDTYVDRPRVDLEVLKPLLRTRHAEAPALTVVVHADQAVAHGRVAGMLNVVRGAGVSRLAIAPKASSGRP